MEVDILEFKVPVDNNKTLFVWDIQPSHTEDQIYEGLYSVFSSYGPLYLLKVCPNAPLNPPGFYALIKFYSAAQALKAQQQTDGRPLFQNSPLKVRLSSKQTPHFLLDSSRPLSHARCLELANHCLGFNGWTSDIITLKELTNEEEGEEEEEEGGVRRRRLRFGCLLQLSFPHHGQVTRAAAVVEDSFTCSGPDVLIQKRCRLQKQVREKALVQAFTAVLLILLGNGKVMVEVKQTSDQFLPEQTEGVLQVREFSWSDFAPDEEEGDDEDWDLTVS
ncbi:RAD52 motif-containing protein 1 [Epinephelus fuscoguttatus]|uniref:RAD52 motif-containing protein 1 n=1 Tax=Epinephelus fuscoguttatus TaxID=293821 RepID=UPI0020D060B7|nr:RAD52 motif-containing protein 1 [Epinephelus fuscoguttatus]